MFGLDIEPFRQKAEGESFIEKFPVGTLVVNTSIINAANGEFPYALTDKGAIYENPKLTEVNVRDINDVKGSTDTWSIKFLQRGQRT